MEPIRITEIVVEGIAEVYKTFDPEMLASVYEDRLLAKFSQAGLQFEKQNSLSVNTESSKLIPGYNLVLSVGNKATIEVSAFEDLQQIRKARITAYFKIPNIKMGVLVSINYH